MGQVLSQTNGELSATSADDVTYQSMDLLLDGLRWDVGGLERDGHFMLTGCRWDVVATTYLYLLPDVPGSEPPYLYFLSGHIATFTACIRVLHICCR